MPGKLLKRAAPPITCTTSGSRAATGGTACGMPKCTHCRPPPAQRNPRDCRICLACAVPAFKLSLPQHPDISSLRFQSAQKALQTRASVAVLSVLISEETQHAGGGGRRVRLHAAHAAAAAAPGGQGAGNTLLPAGGRCSNAGRRSWWKWRVSQLLLLLQLLPAVFRHLSFELAALLFAAHRSCGRRAWAWYYVMSSFIPCFNTYNKCVLHTPTTLYTPKLHAPTIYIYIYIRTIYTRRNAGMHVSFPATFSYSRIYARRQIITTHSEHHSASACPSHSGFLM